MNHSYQQKVRGRHLYWTNFALPIELSKRTVAIGSRKDEFNKLCKFHEIDISTYKGEQRPLKIARNLVDYEAGLTIFQCANGAFKSNNINQLSLILNP